jgi:Mrp family chromosome partitioning ATPase
LLDFDLRNPTQHRLLDQPLTPGTCEVLRGEATIDDAIRRTPVDALDMIPAGECDALAINQVARDGLDRLFSLLEERYEFVVVDSAPVLLVTDALMVGQHVDAVLLSVLRHVSRVPALYQAFTRINSVGIRVLGGVIAGMRDQPYGYGYGYGYGNHDAGRQDPAGGAGRG